MNDKRRQAYLPYVREIAKRMRLSDWEIFIADYDPPNPEAVASNHCVWGRKRSWIALSCQFLDDEDEEEQRHTIVHELLHCTFDSAWKTGEASLPPAVTQSFKMAMELGIDSVADAIAPLMPLPSEVKRKKSRIRS